MSGCWTASRKRGAAAERIAEHVDLLVAELLEDHRKVVADVDAG